MNEQVDPRFLALLVHRRLLSADLVAKALASGDPRGFLRAHAAVSDEKWREWQRTAAGTRPVLHRYELGELLGEGGSARVYRAVDRTDSRTVAVKVLKSELAADRDAVDAFVREAKLLIELDCPHLVKGYRVARDGEALFCAMEYIDGGCVLDELAGGARVEELRALDVVAQVATALQYLHGRGLVHRDVKPGNIMVDRSGRAVLVDLGFAVRGGAAVGDADTTAGTVHYIAPEQARGQGELDVRADIYALGATLYHLVTGALPFAGDSQQEIMAKQVREALSGAAIRALGLSSQTHYFIEKMMAKEREIRFQDPAQLAQEIRGHLEAKQREREAAVRDAGRPPSKRRLRRFL